MKRCFLVAALLVLGVSAQAQAQYYNYGPRYYPGPIAYNADAYLNHTMRNTRRYYNFNSSGNYLRHGMRNTRYFYGL